MRGIEAYISPGTGKYIETREQQREDLKRSGAILHEPGLEQDIARNKAEKAEKDFAPVAAAVDATVTQLVNKGLIES